MTPSFLILDVGDVLITTNPNAPWAALSALGNVPADQLARDPAVLALVRAFGRGQVDTDEFCNTMSSLAHCEPRDIPRAWTSVIGNTDAPMLTLAEPWRYAGRLLLASDTDPLHWTAVLKRLGAPWHDTPAILSWQLGIGKDDPSYFARLTASLPCRPSHALYIDDQQRHINTARATGITTALYTNAWQLRIPEWLACLPVDEGYYQRRADEERKRLESHQRKVHDADRAIEKAGSAADKAKTSAARERARGALRRAQEGRTKATKAVAECQKKIHGYERKAREAATTARKKQADANKRESDRQKRADARAHREQEQEERRRQSLEAARAREVTGLRQRTAELEQELAAIRTDAPVQITILFLAGTAEGGEEPLRLGREFREVEERIRSSEYRDRINVKIEHAARINDILAAFNRVDPDVVHFSGHGDTDMLLFEGPDGRPHELRDEHLGLLLGAARKPIRLLVLNACVSAQQAAMATDYVEAAIGMDVSILDDSAKSFAGQLYGAIAEGNTIGNAFLQAKTQAQIVNDDSEHGQPRLFIREDMDADTMVLVKGT